MKPAGGVITVAGIIVFSAIGVLSAIVEVLYVPYYVGAYVFPISAVVAVSANFALPRLMRQFIDSGPLVALPTALWVLTVIVLGFANTGDGDVIVPGYGQSQYVALATIFLGALAGAIGLMRSPIRPDADTDADSDSDSDSDSAAPPEVRSGSARR